MSGIAPTSAQIEAPVLAGASERARGMGSRLHALGRTARRKKTGTVSVVLLVVIVVVGVFAPVIAPYGKDQVFSIKNPKYDPNSFSPDALNPTTLALLSNPSPAHILGTDNLGRDLFTRLVLGARLSLLVGVVSAGLATVCGSVIGIICGYFGGKVDLIVQRIVDAMMAIPALVFLLLLVQIGQPSLGTTVAALSVLGSFGASRVVRSAAVAVRSEVYMDAARALGARHRRLMLVHVLPNVFAPIIVLFSIAIGANILAEAGLSFLNLGVPGPSWGQIVSQGRAFLTQKPLMSVAGGVAITVTVLAFNLLGDALRDLLDPRMRGAT